MSGSEFYRRSFHKDGGIPRTCSVCGETKPDDQFYRNDKTKCGACLSRFERAIQKSAKKGRTNRLAKHDQARGRGETKPVAICLRVQESVDAIITKSANDRGVGKPEAVRQIIQAWAEKMTDRERILASSAATSSAGV